MQFRLYDIVADPTYRSAGIPRGRHGSANALHACAAAHLPVRGYSPRKTSLRTFTRRQRYPTHLPVRGYSPRKTDGGTTDTTAARHPTYRSAGIPRGRRGSRSRPFSGCRFHLPVRGYSPRKTHEENVRRGQAGLPLTGPRVFPAEDLLLPDGCPRLAVPLTGPRVFPAEDGNGEQVGFVQLSHLPVRGYSPRKTSRSRLGTRSTATPLTGPRVFPAEDFR